MVHYLTVWGSNSNEELNIPEKLGQPIGLNSNLISGYENVSKFYLGYRHGIASKPSSQIYFKPLYSGFVITGYDPIIIPINTSWGDNTFLQREINRRIGNLTFYYNKFDLGNDTTYAIDAQLGLIHGFGFDLIFSDLFDATGQIVNWSFADLNSNGIPPGNLVLYPRNFKDVKAGDGYVLALNSGNKITGWGNSGNPVISGKKYTGLNTLGNIKQITAGQTHALVLFESGLISGWGDNSLGQLSFDTGILYSGVKISTKNNHNLALGFGPPTITNITGTGSSGTFNIYNLGYIDQEKNITGLDIQYSLDRKEWVSHLFNTNLSFNKNTSFLGLNLPTGDENYYVRLVEFYDTFGINTGSTSIYNPFNKNFDIWSDYRVYGWGDSEFGIQNIPEKIKNERVIDIAAGYNSNIILTENPIAESEGRVSFDLSEFLDSNVFVSGLGIALFNNKTFLLDGSANDKPLYRYYLGIPAVPTDLSIFWDTTRWVLYSGFSNLIYYSEDDVDYPWLGSWAADNPDYFPAPTLLEIPSFVPPVPPPCTGFIFDTA